MKIVINAGHTKFGKGTGAVGKLNESIETRIIAYRVMELLTASNHEIIPAVFDRSDNNLKEAVDLSNDADLFVSIHLNAGGGTGSEVYTWQGKETSKAKNVLTNLSSLGFKNRGIKDGSDLYVIKKTKCESMLIEVCFVDNDNDFKIYDAEKIAAAIARSLL